MSVNWDYIHLITTDFGKLEQGLFYCALCDVRDGKPNHRVNEEALFSHFEAIHSTEVDGRPTRCVHYFSTDELVAFVRNMKMRALKEANRFERWMSDPTYAAEDFLVDCREKP